MKHLVIIGTVFPEPNSTAAGKRMLQLIELFSAQNFRISFLSAAAFSEHSLDLKSKKVETYSIKINDPDFEDFIAKLQPDFVLFDRFTTEEQFGWKIAETCPNSLKILDTEDLHFLRKAREQAFKQSREITDEDLMGETFKREIASILRCDLSLIISEFEMKLLSEKFKISQDILHYIPLFADEISLGKPYAERRNFLSIGNFLHEPNWQTVLQLKKLWPKIKKKLPETELHIYGAYCTQKALQLHNAKEGFLIRGRAENLEKIFSESRVLLAPIPFGAGIKGKLLESMQFGLPSVTSSVGAEAMHENFSWNGFICDIESDFVEKSVLLYENQKIWEKSQKNGFEIIKKRFQKEESVNDFWIKINTISHDLPNHRNQNFLGQLLQHHTLQSSKYLGKWIEEKNKI